jgi:hypothetical protein
MDTMNTNPAAEPLLDIPPPAAFPAEGEPEAWSHAQHLDFARRISDHKRVVAANKLAAEKGGEQLPVPPFPEPDEFRAAIDSMRVHRARFTQPAPKEPKPPKELKAPKGKKAVAGGKAPIEQLNLDDLGI